VIEPCSWHGGTVFAFSDFQASNVLAYDFVGDRMSEKSKTSWNLCISCKWWQIEPDAKVAKDTAGLCIDEALQPFKLRVTGDSGCNRYMPGTPARAEGSSGKPPTAAPVR
jgi:hypothetical protein